MIKFSTTSNFDRRIADLKNGYALNPTMMEEG